MENRKIAVEICCGTACYMLGAAELLRLETIMPEDWKESVDVSAGSLLQRQSGRSALCQNRRRTDEQRHRGIRLRKDLQYSEKPRRKSMSNGAERMRRELMIRLVRDFKAGTLEETIDHIPLSIRPKTLPTRCVSKTGKE